MFAADGGAKACLEASVRPACVVGDFDSQPRASLPPDWNGVEDRDQHFTDFEKVLRRMPEEMTSLTVLGGLGGRMDHAWNNLVLAAGVYEACEVCFLGDREILWRVTPACPLHVDVGTRRVLSLLPMGETGGVSSEGLRWELKNAALGPGNGLAQSNEAEGKITVRVARGVLFVWAERAEP